MSTHLLSKSSFIKGLQCHKALYLYKNHYQLRDPVSKEKNAVFNRGHKVGFLAHKLFPGGIDVSPSGVSRFSESIEKTKILIESGNKVIYEPAFLHSEILVALDIIEPLPSPSHHAGNGGFKWNAYEVKSSAKISSTYILDASLQYWVIKNAGMDISDFFILNLNTNYFKKGSLELEKLFSKTSVMEEILKKQSYIEENIFILKNVLAKKEIPGIPIGKHCFEPYECDFKGYCWKNISKNPVFEIPDIPIDSKIKLYSSGIKNLDEVSKINGLTDFQKIHLNSKKNGRPFINKSELKKFIDSLKSPLTFVDFEVMMPAIPLFENTRPFQNIPFQFSIIKEACFNNGSEGKKNNKFITFLAEPGTDPRKEFIENYLLGCDGEGSIIVFDAILEKSILNSLKKDFPLYSEKIDQCLNRVIDLLIPFKNKHIYHYKMKGNFSLKDISNAFLDEKKFENLKISNGRLSMIAYESLVSETDLIKIIETKEALAEYSKTDVETMVELVEIIKKSIK